MKRELQGKKFRSASLVKGGASKKETVTGTSIVFRLGVIR
jgi:hypothetical protein